jgi:hypothetical protein
MLKGLLTGAATEIPVLAATVWVLSRAGYGDPEVTFMRIIRLTAVFAGIAAVLTAAGIGRLAAHASGAGGRPRAILVAARAHAVASAGLVMIAAIPHGHLPEHSLGWLPIPLAGMISGALCGALIGAVCGGATPVSLGDALRHLLSPEDLIRLGASLRTRTTSLFEGIFEPAPPPPPAPPTTQVVDPPPPPPPPVATSELEKSE